MAYAERLFFERPFRYQNPPPRRAVGLRVRQHQTVSEGNRKRLMPVRPQIEADFKREPGFAVQRAGNQHGVLGSKDPEAQSGSLSMTG